MKTYTRDYLISLACMASIVPLEYLSPVDSAWVAFVMVGFLWASVIFGIKAHIGMVREIHQTDNKLYICELRLCEQERLILKPYTLYRFTIDTECERCKELSGSGA